MEKFVEFGKVFRRDPKGFELLKTHLAMFLRTSSLMRLIFINNCSLNHTVLQFNLLEPPRKRPMARINVEG